MLMQIARVSSRSNHDTHTLSATYSHVRVLGGHVLEEVVVVAGGVGLDWLAAIAIIDRDAVERPARRRPSQRRGAIVAQR